MDTRLTSDSNNILILIHMRCCTQVQYLKVTKIAQIFHELQYAFNIIKSFILIYKTDFEEQG